MVGLSRWRSSLTAGAAHGQGTRRPGASEPIPSIEERTTGMKKLDGFFPLYWDEAAGQLLLEIPRLNTEVLHVDRAGGRARLERHRARPRQLTGSRIVKFERVGPTRADGAAELRVPGRQRQSGRSARGARRLCALGAVGLHRGGRDAAIACWSTTTDFLLRDATNMAGGCAQAPTGSSTRAARSTCR